MKKMIYKIDDETKLDEIQRIIDDWDCYRSSQCLMLEIKSILDHNDNIDD